MLRLYKNQQDDPESCLLIQVVESDSMLKTRMGIVPARDGHVAGHEEEENEEEEQEEEETFAFLCKHTAGNKMTDESQAMHRLMPWASEIILAGVAYKVSSKQTLYTYLCILASQPFNAQRSSIKAQPLIIYSTSTLNL
jgi:hypothetical protein